MKRLQRIRLAIVSLVLVAVLSACSMYSIDVSEGSAVGIANEEKKDAFLSEYVWDGNEDHMRIDVRELELSYNYDGYDFGGYYKDANERIFYRIHLVPELDPNNKNFYKSETDGKIYKKDSNELVPGLWYPEAQEQEQAQ